MRTLKTALLWIVLLLPVRGQASPVDQALLASIRQMALDYLDADLRRDTAKMDALLDATFRLTFFTRGGLRVTDKPQYLDWMRKHPPMSVRFMIPEAVPLSVVGNVATVKAVTRDRVEVLTIWMVGSYKKIVASCIQPRVVEFR